MKTLRNSEQFFTWAREKAIPRMKNHDWRWLNCFSEDYLGMDAYCLMVLFALDANMLIDGIYRKSGVELRSRRPFENKYGVKIRLSVENSAFSLFNHFDVLIPMRTARRKCK